jgi:hypothetical protein
MLSAIQVWRCLSFVAVLLLFSGCAITPRPATDRPFEFSSDTFAYANELVWEYDWDAAGRWRGKPRAPEPEYSHHCFVVVRAARQFFWHAEFHPDTRPADDLTYRRLVRQVLNSSPRKPSPTGHRIRIPGYRHLREFSASHAPLLKAESGGAWLSYFQRGHWRMIFPFSRRSQERTARDLSAAAHRNRPAVAHIVCFPSLRINHAVLVFDAREDPERVVFRVYDPNTPEQPAELTFDRATRTFHFPTTDYFPGGNVNVYEVYRNLLY